MKLKHKLFCGLAALWIPFLILAYLTAAVESSPLGFIIVAIVFSCLVILLINYILKMIIVKAASKNLGKNQIEKNIEDNPFPDYTTLLKQEFNNNPLSRFAHYDLLMDLPNRILFNELLNKALSHAKRHNKVLAILIIDIEPKKIIRAKLQRTLEHSVLMEIGSRFATTLRTEDMIGKLEGNEFIILLNDIDKPKFAGTVAKKLLKACAPTIEMDFKQIVLKTNIGICVYPTDGSSLEELIKKSYQALHKAKTIGSDSYQFYTNQIDVEAREYTKMDADLRKAIQDNELVLYYQPKLKIKDGNIKGVEALLRWVHPELGILTPNKFIDVAEESGLIMQIGEWALREACKTNKFWQNEGYEHLTVALNVSPKQFYNPKIIEVIKSVLEETELEPHYIELEISESTVMNNPDKSVEIISSLKSLGVQISIDHFGTGYTSINLLKRFPVTSLKIDRSFIKDIPNKPDDSAISSAIISLGHNLGMEVIAEGVETAEQMQFLTKENCDLVQGYFLSYPAPAKTIVLQFKKLLEKTII